MDIAVAGGTGTVGRYVVAAAKERGHRVVSLSRADGVDLATGRGLAEALAGVDTVIDAAGIQTLSTRKAVDFFTAAGRNLLAAEQSAGVSHHVALSIVGIDQAASGLYAGKLAQEAAVQSGQVPWSILRSTQFHEFVPMTLGLATLGPVVLTPRMLTQPVAAREVAEALVDAAEAGPQGRLPDLGGPQRHELINLVKAYLKHQGQRKWVVGIPTPGAMGRAMRNGDLIPTAGAAVGRQNFQEWLAALD